ncbi:polyketide cyclase [Silicimonas algicola]|uniref:Uncharacterized protein YndB with AHSA1/START domain n=1 Tax=Silicimonas algicola TaxID=1826607 RepID=A0A316GEU2_9RHOB|nr:SRPBCC family protein [Silicimonas algicola]AZQ66410.1 polyketide cyclase [Silicimonas algicola]PWK58745.1 uncharacterized protein YndB with AHSA1/START domain [Silicimonas algicola]
MTAAQTEFVYVTYIRATPEKVFDAIVNPAVARLYWGHENVSDWTPGARWEHVRANDARAVELVGEVLEIDAPKRLVMSWANASQEGDAEKTSRVAFDIEPYDGMVRLTVTHDRLEAGGGMFNGISKGWPIVLSSMKSYLESGEAIDIFAKPTAA